MTIAPVSLPGSSALVRFAATALILFAGALPAQAGPPDTSQSPAGNGANTGVVGGGATLALQPLAVPGRTFYVDAKHGDDVNEGTSRGAPLRTLKEAARRVSGRGGDKLVLRGRFREPLTLNYVNNPVGGAPDPNAPTVVQCDFDREGRPMRAVIDGGIHGAASFPFDMANLPPGFGPGTGNYLDRGVTISNSNYVTVSGIHVRGIIGTGLLTWRSSDIEIEHCSIAWLSNSAMKLSRGDFGEPMARNIRVRHCRINQSNLGRWQDRATQTGFNLATETVSFVGIDGFEMAHCVLSNSLMVGIDFKFDARDGRIHHNLVQNTRVTGIYANEGEDTRIHNNLVRHVGWYDPQDGSGLIRSRDWVAQAMPGVMQSPESGSVGIRVGTGDLGGPAFESGRCARIDVYENVISWTAKAGIAIFDEWREEGLSGSVMDQIRVYNNVIHRANQTPAIAATGLQLDASLTNSLIANNIVTECGKPGIVVWPAAPTTFFATNEVTNNLLWANALGGITGNAAILADPEFVQVPSQPGGKHSFLLQRSSPAIDMGLPLPAIPSPATPVDLGAYQFGLSAWSPGPLGGS